MVPARFLQQLFDCPLDAEIYGCLRILGTAQQGVLLPWLPVWLGVALCVELSVLQWFQFSFLQITRELILGSDVSRYAEVRCWVPQESRWRQLEKR